MDNTPLISEIEPGTDISSLEPGMYITGCSGKFQDDPAREDIDCLLSGEMAGGLFTGVLMPYFLHNINNLMVGVMGNLDLAAMFMPDIQKVESKLGAARASTGSVVGFIRDISEVSYDMKKDAVTQGDIARILVFISAACGRSVNTVGIETMALPENIPSGRPAMFVNAFKGMGAWCVLCMGGNGTIQGSISQGRVSFRWSRPEDSGRSHMPGGGNAEAILSVAGRLAASAGCRLVVEEWTTSSGAVTLGYK